MEKYINFVFIKKIMTVSERQLEENEAKIDNILHKVLKSCHHMQDMIESIERFNLGKEEFHIKQRLKNLLMLSETIENLTLLADQIDIQNEKITLELEDKITEELDEAILKIKEASELIREKQEEE
jgi:hypothetical protein